MSSTAIIILILAGVLLQGAFIVVEHKEKYVPAVILKGSASLMFVILGFLAFRGLPGVALAKRIFIGLVFGMLGDILLDLRFVFAENGQKVFLIGIAAFLTGHILYLVALIPHASRLGLCVGIGAVLAAALLIYIFKTMTVKTAFKIFGIVYLGAVIIMTVIALGIALSDPTGQAVTFAAGAVLFTASDIVLIFNTFSGGETKFSLRITNLSLYYIGQVLIACSLFFLV